MSENGQILALTTTYKCNEFLSDSDFELFERMKRDNPRRYRTAGLAQWGVDGDTVYENYDVLEFDWKEVLRRHKTNTTGFGLDFGFSLDQTAFCGAVLDKVNREIYVFCEIYETHMTNRKIYEAIDEMGFSQEQIIADCANPKDIAELRNEFGMYRIRPCRKGKDSINNGIKLIQDYHIYIHPRCTNFIKEISGYVWEKNTRGEYTGKPVGKNDHLCLTGDTLVCTTDGMKRIDSLVGSQGFVYTVDENTGERLVKPFYNVCMTQESADIVRVEFDDGTYIDCTPNHPILTTKGWKPAWELTKNDDIYEY